MFEKLLVSQSARLPASQTPSSPPPSLCRWVRQLGSPFDSSGARKELCRREKIEKKEKETVKKQKERTKKLKEEEIGKRRRTFNSNA
mmetsp:Transcript_1629/g.3348  ORF Transcript_1629/g.3348 Transcript_1629/m.3348 type:complete len:87 (+) Transcript_1629:351-611(+)